jgi:hypothetical protein
MKTRVHLCLLLFLSAAATAAPADVGGPWNVRISFGKETLMGIALLNQTGDKIAGSIGADERNQHPLDGVVDGNRVTPTTHPRAGRTGAFAKCSLAEDGDKMSGTTEGGRHRRQGEYRVRLTQVVALVLRADLQVCHAEPDVPLQSKVSGARRTCAMYAKTGTRSLLGRRTAAVSVWDSPASARLAGVADWEPWERAIVAFISPHERVLVAGCGTGLDLLALTAMGCRAGAGPMPFAVAVPIREPAG